MEDQFVQIPKDDVKEILASLALSDNLGDAFDAIAPLTKAVGIKVSDVTIEKLSQLDLLPDYLKDD